jgi:uncharacterized protein YfaP (DUF2135 family)
MFSNCKKAKEEEPVPEPTLAGKPGNPRFNLQFTNETNVDLDLYVQTPNGSKIYYSNQSAQGGELDVDCLCGTCPNGPNENIFWQDGTAPGGTYKFWVKYYGSCGNNGNNYPPSTYTLRLLRNSQILETYTGTLSTLNSISPMYTFTK